MIRRPSPAAIPLGLGLLALFVGLFALRGMLAAEREDALAGIEMRLAAARRHAARELAARLARRAAEARRQNDAALADPLLPCPGCFHSEAGTQLLPRVRPSSANPPGRSARSYYEELTSAPAAPDRTEDATWLERRRLHASCRARPDRAALAVVEHRARYALPVEQEIGSALALLATCPPSGPMLSALVRGGVDVPGSRRVEGLEPYLLREQRHLAPGDAAFAADRILAAALSAGIRTDDFEARLREMAGQPLALPGRLDRPAIAPGEGGSVWYLRPISGGVEGVSVELAPLLAAIAEEMRSGALLRPGDRLELRGPAGRPLALADAVLDVWSPDAGAARDDIERRHLVKLGLVVLCAAMGAVIALLGLALQGRRRRILEAQAVFVADVSHELRTPLASMRVLAETLARRTQNLEQVRDYPARLLRDIDGMSFLVDNILSFNRMRRGRWEPRREAIKLRELIEGACQEAGERSGRQVDADVRAGAIVFHADPDLLRLLFRNLAVNGVTYNRRDPVEIHAEGRPGRDGSLEVLFTDNGAGIEPEERQRVFAEFYRGRHSGAARGSGLGLALCRRIMALHGGTIAIEASGHEGTTFRLWFPRAPS